MGASDVNCSAKQTCQVFAGLVILQVMWYLIGFSLVFDDDYGGVIGGVKYGCVFCSTAVCVCMLSDAISAASTGTSARSVCLKVRLLLYVGRSTLNQCTTSSFRVFFVHIVSLVYISLLSSWCVLHITAPQIPGLAYATFESMFAAITPLLMTGAVAERMRMRAFLIIIILWEVIVYYPLAHWYVHPPPPPPSNPCGSALMLPSGSGVAAGCSSSACWTLRAVSSSTPRQAAHHWFSPSVRPLRHLRIPHTRLIPTPLFSAGTA